MKQPGTHTWSGRAVTWLQFAHLLSVFSHLNLHMHPVAHISLSKQPEPCLVVIKVVSLVILLTSVNLCYSYENLPPSHPLFKHLICSDLGQDSLLCEDCYMVLSWWWWQLGCCLSVCIKATCGVYLFKFIQSDCVYWRDCSPTNSWHFLKFVRN